MEYYNTPKMQLHPFEEKHVRESLRHSVTTVSRLNFQHYYIIHQISTEFSFSMGTQGR